MNINNYFSNLTAEERRLPFYIVTIGESLKEHRVHRPAGIPDYQILFCADGRGIVTVKESDIPLKAGQAMILPPFSPHEYRPSDDSDWHTLWVTFNGRAVSDAFGFSAEIRDLSSIKFESAFFELLKAKKENEEGFRRLTSAPLYELLLSCADCPALTDSSDSKQNEEGLKRVIGYIAENYTKTIELFKLSEISGFSEGHLCRAFKEYTHMRPIEYVTFLRIETAKSYLWSHPNASIASVARSIGYENSVYFSKIFKEKCGVSPSEYKKLARSTENKNNIT